jgi:hypothetical protein
MKFEKLKEEIKAIAEIADSVPDAFKERCFEILLENLLGSTAPETKKLAQDPPPAPPVPAVQKKEPAPASENGATIPLPSQIKVLMGKTGVTAAELAKVIMFDDEVAHFIQEPQGNKIARGQIEWALLLALKKGIEKNVLEVDPEVVRSLCQEKGFYDAANFQKNFKGANTAKLFAGEMVKQGSAQKLSNDGMTELGKIVKEYAARPAQ